MNKKFLAVFIASLGLALSGCSSASNDVVPRETVTVTATPTPTEVSLTSRQKDAIFIETFRNSYPRSFSSDRELIGLVDSACHAFGRGASYHDIAQAVIENAGSQVEELAFAIGAGVVVYCPQYSDKIP